MSTYPSTPPLHHRFVQTIIDDVSTASSAWVVPGFRGKLKKLMIVIDTAITTADASITVEVNGTAIDGAVLTVESTGSAVGDAFSVTVPGGSTNFFGQDDAIEVITNGGSTTASKGVVTLQVEPT